MTTHDNDNNDEITFKTKTLHYRRAQFVNYDNVYNLQELVKKSLNVASTVGQRYLDVLNDDNDISDNIKSEDLHSSKLFINHHTERWGIQFFDLTKYTSDTNMNVITVDDTAKYLDVEQMMPASTEDGKKREFLESIMYVAVFKNHIALIQSAALRSRDLEKYFNWFLKKTSAIEDGHVVLSTEIPKAIKKKIEKNDTKSVKIGTPLVDSVNGESVSTIQNKEDSFDTKSLKLNPQGRGLSMLKTLFGNDKSLMDKFGIDLDLLSSDAIDGSDIQVSLELTYKRKASQKSKEILNSVTTAMRHSHPEDVVVEIENVGKLTGKDLNIRKPLSVKYYNGVIDPEDLYLKIRDWMKLQIELDEIEVEDS
ncbi:hypothetical protein [Photobacterium leiognathi]|uniref:hypothetical protein n=1 Tax=Photobacterium leiognathi TaxID=553611 RepID=UPI002980BF7B|nr:hypothetical protein [Photobacterium leiognathi]